MNKIMKELGELNELTKQTIKMVGSSINVGLEESEKQNLIEQMRSISKVLKSLESLITQDKQLFKFIFNAGRVIGRAEATLGLLSKTFQLD